VLILDGFDVKNDHIVIGTFRTVSTGVSKNTIRRIIGIDMGDSINTAIQAIGRGMRLDGGDNSFEFYDVYSDLKYGSKHAANRMKLYKSENHPYKKNHLTLEVL